MTDLFKNNIPSPFNYTGSKFKLLSQIKEYLPKNINTFWDIFCGGGSVFINIEAKKKYANDIIKPLIDFYKFLQENNLETILKRINEVAIKKDNKTEYVNLRKKFNNNNYDNTQRCIDFFILICSCTNNMIRFNKKFGFNQTWGKRGFNLNTEKKLIEFHNRIYKNNNIEFLNCSFDKLRVNKGDFVYLDPPYLITEAGYNAFWSKELEKKLYNFIDNLDSQNIKFMLSNVNKHKGLLNPHIDKLKKYKIIILNCNYNKVSRSGNSDTEEILVINY